MSPTLLDAPAADDPGQHARDVAGVVNPTVMRAFERQAKADAQAVSLRAEDQPTTLAASFDVQKKRSSSRPPRT